MNPEISVVLVTFNRAAFLPRTLDGILNQTFENFELIICDDCSSDGTQTICEEYARRDLRIRYVRNSMNVGMPHNLNAGLRRAQCELVANLHDGDIYYPTLLEKWRRALLDYPTAAFVFNVYRHLSPDGTSGIVTSTYKPLITGHEFLEKVCFAFDELYGPVWGTVMGHKSVYEALEYFDPKYSFYADFDMWFRIAESHDIAFVPELLIDLPSKSVMPSLFDLGPLRTHALIFEVYWAARCRHFRGRPVKLTAELGKQIVDFGYSRARRILNRL